MSENNSITAPVNYQYVMNYIDREVGNNSSTRVLDYGCGDGEVVEHGLAGGVDIYGADIFYGGSDSYAVVQQKGLLGKQVLKIVNDHVDFPDDFFDLIVSNQVFEHVEDIDAVLFEINRLLKPGGKFLCLFPSKDVWREGHCGIPFLHWFPKDSQLRYYYAYALRSLGFGKYKSNLPKEQWVKYILTWLDQYCFYRSRKVIKQSFYRYFKIQYIENDYVSFRIKTTHMAHLESLARFPLTKPLVTELFRKLGGLVILCDKL